MTDAITTNPPFGQNTEISDGTRKLLEIHVTGEDPKNSEFSICWMFRGKWFQDESISNFNSVEENGYTILKIHDLPDRSYK